jgi:putative hemolysin
MLWTSLAQFMVANAVDTMVGCASISMADGGHVAASLWAQLQRSALAPPDLRVRPRLALPTRGLRRDLDVEPPPLLKGYLRCGAQVLGSPAWDPIFGTVDLPILLRLQDLPAPYRRRFVGR